MMKTKRQKMTKGESDNDWAYFILYYAKDLSKK